MYYFNWLMICKNKCGVQNIYIRTEEGYKLCIHAHTVLFLVGILHFSSTAESASSFYLAEKVLVRGNVSLKRSKTVRVEIASRYVC